MNFSYNEHTKKYTLGDTEYTKSQFIQYIESDMLADALSIESSMNVEAGIEQGTPSSDKMVPEQLIFFGVPGSGKSYRIDELTGKIAETQKIRVVFHPDYTNSDFVGQILPKSVDGNVKYEFKPGPFTQILWRAIKEPEKKFYLIIEEINRGNAAAIFGDIFQLLDRINKKEDLIGDNEKLTYGWSKYFISNDYINNYLRSPVEYGSQRYVEEHGNQSIEIGSIVFTMNSGIRLPPNLSILATMNTSDQNVFTLDNAFQRRWNMELISNSLKPNSNQYKLKIQGTDICWGKFRDAANLMISSQTGMMGISSLEDTQIGAYFVQAENDSDEIKASVFASKVLKYLWDDAFKLDRSKAFKIKDSFEKAVMQFIPSQEFFEKDSSSKIELDKILSEKFYNAIYGKDESTNNEEDQE